MSSSSSSSSPILTSDQESQLVQFKEFTSYDESNEHDKVVRLLTVCNWNLEIAVARYFDNDFPTLFDDHPITPGTSSPPITIDQQQQQQQQQPINREIPLPPPQAIAFDHYPFLDLIPKLPKAIPIQNRWKNQVGLSTTNDKQLINKKMYTYLSPILFILALFPKLIYVLGIGLNKILGSFFPNLFKLLGLRDEPNDFPRKPQYLNKEEIESYDIKTYIDSIIGETTDIPIYKGLFNDAFNKSKTELKWMMCILINSECELSNKFIKSYLNNSQFIKFINDNNIILYIGDVMYPEPFEVGNCYNVLSLPYINLIANVSSTGTTFPLMSTVTKFQNFDNNLINKESFKKLIKRLQKIIDKYEPQLISQRFDQQETQFSRLIRQQQDDAYQESLLKDKLKKQKLKDEKLKLELLQKEEELIELLKIQKLKFLKLNSKKVLLNDDKPLVKGEYTTIQLRNHQGERIIKKFLKNQTLYDIFLFVECKNFIKQECESLKVSEIEFLETLNEDDYKLTEDESYEHQFKFDLVSPMPRMKLTPSKETLLKDVKELWPNGSLLIEMFEEEEEDDE
ncbi:hypothetical protein CANARDRAFT_174204 [[Candida] arabinofermentans NRRL YB-2248]|uniref:UBX domain-containing protein n=1 Tax=[Candida] arabinofermentans NRRL YB-2248 TaxID=983967 RepID=A0A1E4T5T2_9ASCO|nr:hypothetical protein CANARDRAFT_174204 [[Candida] arabinofermentans NRRL YB-2248]